MRLEEYAEQYGLDSYHQGLVPVRDEKGIWTDGVYAVYQINYKGTKGVEALRKLIESLEESIKTMVEAGME